MSDDEIVQESQNTQVKNPRKRSKNIHKAPRENQEKPSVVEAYLGTLHLDDSIQAPDGMVYGWIAETINGVPAVNNVQDAYRRGWRPVPSKRHPSAAYPGIGEIFKGMDTNFIKRKGQILMERPKELHKAELEAQEEKNKSIAKASNWTNPEHQDPRMPNVTYANQQQFQSFAH